MDRITGWTGDSVSASGDAEGCLSAFRGDAKEMSLGVSGTETPGDAAHLSTSARPGDAAHLSTSARPGDATHLGTSARPGDAAHLGTSARVGLDE